MSWTKEEIKEMTGVLMRRAHGDGRDRQEVETICLLAETSIMNRESCERLMDKVEELKTDHAAEVARLEAECAELVGVLVDVIRQATWNQEPANLKADDDPEDTWSISVGEHYDSGALSAYASGLRLLARLGKVQIVCQYGRSVIAVDAAPAKPQPPKEKGGKP